MVGSHQEVANLIGEYHSLGFDEFILSGYPHLEEAYWFAEGVLPLLAKAGCNPHDFSGIRCVSGGRGRMRWWFGGLPWN